MKEIGFIGLAFMLLSCSSDQETDEQVAPKLEVGYSQALLKKSFNSGWV